MATAVIKELKEYKQQYRTRHARIPTYMAVFYTKRTISIKKTTIKLLF